MKHVCPRLRSPLRPENVSKRRMCRLAYLGMVWSRRCRAQSHPERWEPRTETVHDSFWRLERLNRALLPRESPTLESRLLLLRSYNSSKVQLIDFRVKNKITALEAEDGSSFHVRAWMNVKRPRFKQFSVTDQKYAAIPEDASRRGCFSSSPRTDNADRQMAVEVRDGRFRRWVPTPEV
jgi:hypothetical protein